MNESCHVFSELEIFPCIQLATKIIRVTRAFSEIVHFLVKMWKKLWKWSKLSRKGQNLCIKTQYIGFLLLNIMDHIFKISTFVETLVTQTKISGLFLKKHSGGAHQKKARMH